MRLQHQTFGVLSHWMRLLRMIALAMTAYCAQGMDYFLTIDGLLRFQDRTYVLPSSKPKNVILREFHVKPYSGHLLYQKTLTIVKRFYYWINLKRDVAKFLASCFDCERVKAGCKHPSGSLQPFAIREWKWEVISTDFIIGLPKKVRQHDSIIVFVDRLTIFSHFI